MPHRPECQPDLVGPIARRYAQDLRAIAESIAGLGLTPDQRDSLIISANLLESMADGWNVITPQPSSGWRLMWVGDMGDEPEMLALFGLQRGLMAALNARANIVRATLAPQGLPVVTVMDCDWTRHMTADQPAEPLNGRWLLSRRCEGYSLEWISAGLTPINGVAA